VLVKKLNDYIDESTLADVILDRFFHKVHRNELSWTDQRHGVRYAE